MRRTAGRVLRIIALSPLTRHSCSLLLLELPYKMEEAVADAVDRLSLKADGGIVIEKCAACQATPQADGKPLQDCGGGLPIN